MHQSGHSRAHSMQAVQFSSWSAMTPRARAVGSSFSCGYWTVTGPPPMESGLRVWTISPNVTPRPLMRPGSLGIRRGPPRDRGTGRSLPHHHGDGRDRDPTQRRRDQPLPRELLELVLTEAGVREADPEDDERDEHHLGEQHDRAEDVPDAAVRINADRQVLATEEQRRHDGGEAEGGG